MSRNAATGGKSCRRRGVVGAQAEADTAPVEAVPPTVWEG